MYNLSCGAALLLLSSPIAAATFQADIVINGGSFSAPAAAMSAARTWPTAQILLIEPTDWLGGQGTSQGVSAIDNAWHEPGASLMRLNPSLYYPADYLQFLDDMSPVPGGAPGFGLSPNGTNWVSREGYDPRTAAWVLDQMVADYPNITVLKLTVVKDLNITAVNDAEGAGARITDLTLIERTPANGYIPFTDFTSVEFPDWYSTTNSARFTKQVHTVTPVNAGRGLVVIDASETSDAMVLSGARYTVGREISTEEIAANGTLPAMDEDGGNAVVFPFALKGANTTDPETAVSAQFPNFNTYYNSQLGFYGLGARTWQQVWTYRRLRTTAPLFNINTVDVNDVSMQNWNPGNDYFAGFLYTSSASAAAEAASDWRGGLNLTAMAGAELHAIGWYFWLKNNRPGSVPFSDTRLLRGNDPDNVMGTGHGLAKFPYIRGLRHGVGVRNFRITERYWDNTTASTYANTSSFRFFDSVGIGNYAADVRPVSGSSGIAPDFERPAPFYIPLRSLASQNVRNLLFAGKTIAQSYITNSAYRLHPIEWASGSAAGAAAAVMAEEGGIANHELLRIDRLRALQAEIHTNSPIAWQAYDGAGAANAIPDDDGDLIANNRDNAQTFVPFDLATWHYDAVSAEYTLNGNPIGTTVTRINGELVLADVVVNAPGTYTVGVTLRNGSNQVLDTITTSLIVDAFLDPASIVDNTDSGFSTTGSWSSGTAQANKYGTNYRIATGTGNTGNTTATATWQLPTPQAGLYEIYVWYPESFNRSNVSPFRVNHAGGATTVFVNQRVTGGEWVSIGQYNFNGPGTGTVVLSNNIPSNTDLLLADAVRASLVSANNSVENWSEVNY